MAARHYDQSIVVPAPPEQVFAFADDHSRLSSHMNQSSWMMGGGRMSVEADEGQIVGAKIILDQVEERVPLREDEGAVVFFGDLQQRIDQGGHP